MPIDLSFLESLLHEPEGTALDFKSEQYPFANADIGAKAELLKDILAFANSWRRTTAYILIGVKEAKGGRSEVVGVQDHLDDSNLQQFVNGKTQRHVDFSYYAVPIEGVSIGVIEIPQQHRPTYLKQKFGKLGANNVFIRGGSSTRVANPDEIAKMGAEVAAELTPDLSLQWADNRKREVLPSPHAVRSQILEPRLADSIFPQQRRSFLSIDPLINNNYPREVILYAAERALVNSVGLRLENTSDVPARQVRFVGHATKTEGLIIKDWYSNPPSRTPFGNIHGLAASSPDDIDIKVRELTDRWEIEIDFGNVRPSDYAWTDNELFVGSTEPCTVVLQGELRGDNLPKPIECELELRVEVERRAMEPADLLPYLDSE